MSENEKSQRTKGIRGRRTVALEDHRPMGVRGKLMRTGTEVLMELPRKTVTVRVEEQPHWMYGHRANLTPSGKLRHNPLEMSGLLVDWITSSCDGFRNAEIVMATFPNATGPLKGKRVVNEATFDTDAGQVYMSFHWSWIHFKFKYVDKANLLYYGTVDRGKLHGMHGRLNPFSGKFNFNWVDEKGRGCKADELINLIKHEFGTYFFINEKNKWEAIGFVVGVLQHAQVDASKINEFILRAVDLEKNDIPALGLEYLPREG